MYLLNLGTYKALLPVHCNPHACAVSRVESCRDIQQIFITGRPRHRNEQLGLELSGERVEEYCPSLAFSHRIAQRQIGAPAQEFGKLKEFGGVHSSLKTRKYVASRSV
jgi:hypothetical protein